VRGGVKYLNGGRAISDARPEQLLHELSGGRGNETAERLLLGLLNTDDNEMTLVSAHRTQVVVLKRWQLLQEDRQALLLPGHGDGSTDSERRAVAATRDRLQVTVVADGLHNTLAVGEDEGVSAVEGGEALGHLGGEGGVGRGLGELKGDALVLAVHFDKAHC